MAISDGLFQPGSAFAEKYTIERVLGEGGMGVVYRAMHLRLSQRVAIKTLRPEMLERPQIVARFEREARAAAQLRSRNAVRVLDVGELPSGLPFMVMEYLEGRDLAEELEQRGPLPVGEAVDYVLQACAAMAEAHDRGIVHRDLKPANLFLAEEGNGERVLKVLDFGISKFEEAAGPALTATQAAIGTPLYMSPEQVRSGKDVDRRTDVWSMGVILYELITGRTAFGGDGSGAASVGAAIVTDEAPHLSGARADIPPGLDDVLSRALAKKRDDRYADARAFANALWPFAASQRPPSSSHIVQASQPGFSASANDAVSAPTLDASSAPAPHVAKGAQTPPILATDAGWAQSSSTRRNGRTAMIAGGIAVLLAFAATLTFRSIQPATPAIVVPVAHSSPPPSTSLVPAAGATIAPLPTAPASTANSASSIPVVTASASPASPAPPSASATGSARPVPRPSSSQRSNTAPNVNPNRL